MYTVMKPSPQIKIMMVYRHPQTFPSPLDILLPLPTQPSHPQATLICFPSGQIHLDCLEFDVNGTMQYVLCYFWLFSLRIIILRLVDGIAYISKSFIVISE